MYYYTLNDHQEVRGPFTAGEMQSWILTEHVPDNHPAAVAGDSEWHTVGDLLPVIADDVRRGSRPAVSEEEILTKARHSGVAPPESITQLLKQDAGRTFPAARPRKRV